MMYVCSSCLLACQLTCFCSRTSLCCTFFLACFILCHSHSDLAVEGLTGTDGNASILTEPNPVVKAADRVAQPKQRKQPKEAKESVLSK